MTWIIAAITIFCLAGLGSVSFWFAWERLEHYQGQMKRRIQNLEIPGRAGYENRTISPSRAKHLEPSQILVVTRSSSQIFDPEKQEKTTRISNTKALWRTAIAGTRKALSERESRLWREVFHKLASEDARVQQLAHNTGRGGVVSPCLLLSQGVTGSLPSTVLDAVRSR